MDSLKYAASLGILVESICFLIWFVVVGVEPTLLMACDARAGVPFLAERASAAVRGRGVRRGGARAPWRGRDGRANKPPAATPAACRTRARLP